MKRALAWILVAVAAVVVLAIAALLALPSLIDTPRVQSLLANNVSHALGRPVRFTAVKVKVVPLPSVVLKNLEVAEDPAFGSSPFLRLEEGEVRLKLGPLLTGRVELGDIILKKPLIALVQGPDGRWNVATLGPGAEPRGPGRPSRGGSGAGGGAVAAAASRIKLDDGVITYVPHGQGDALTRYRLEDVDLSITGGGPLLRFEGSARLKPGDLALRITEGSLAVGGGRSLIEAALRGKLGLDGKDIGPLVAATVGPTPALGGGIKGTLTLGGTVGAPKATGDVELPTLKVTQVNPQCPEPKKRTLALGTVKLNAAWEDGRFASRPLSTTIEGGTTTTNLVATVDRGVGVQLGDLAIRGLPLKPVLVDYLCQGYAVTGPLDLTGLLSLNPANLWPSLSGTGQFKIGPGKVVGAQALRLVGGVVRLGGAISSLLAADVPASLADSPLDFESITGTYRITNGVVTTQDLLYSSRAMKVAVAGDYSLGDGRMNLDMVVHHGRGQVKAKVTGTAQSPSIRVAPTTVLRDVDPGKVERGVQDLLKRLR